MLVYFHAASPTSDAMAMPIEAMALNFIFDLVQGSLHSIRWQRFDAGQPMSRKFGGFIYCWGAYIQCHGEGAFGAHSVIIRDRLVGISKIIEKGDAPPFRNHQG